MRVMYQRGSLLQIQFGHARVFVADVLRDVFADPSW